MTYPPEIVHAVRDLLTNGCTHRATATVVGVSRHFVGTVASGSRQPRIASMPESEDEDVIAFEREKDGPKERCETCGGMVLLPCRLCHVRELIKEGKVRPLTAADFQP